MTALINNYRSGGSLSRKRLTCSNVENRPGENVTVAEWFGLMVPAQTISTLLSNQITQQYRYTFEADVLESITSSVNLMQYYRVRHIPLYCKSLLRIFRVKCPGPQSNGGLKVVFISKSWCDATLEPYESAGSWVRKIHQFLVTWELLCKRAI